MFPLCVSNVEWEAQTGVSVFNIHFRKLRCMYCPGGKENDWADRLAGKATITSGLRLKRSEVLRILRHYLRAQSQEHHTTNHLEERGVERESAQQPSLKGWEAIISQINLGTFGYLKAP